MTKKTMTAVPIDDDLTQDKVILAIDPSLNRPGFAAVSYNAKKRKLVVLKTSYIDNKIVKDEPVGQKLFVIAREVISYIDKYQPDTFVKERAFAGVPGKRSGTTTLMLAGVAGVIQYLAYDACGKEFIDVAPMTVKKEVGGSGKATKEDVALGLEKYVGKLEYEVDDESDAVAVAVTYALSQGWIDKVEEAQDGKNS